MMQGGGNNRTGINRNCINSIGAILAAFAWFAALPGLAQDSPQYRNGRPGDFDFYVLALSWSPSFCGTEGGRRAQDQCGFGRKLDFVVHGLWPQFTRGFPTECQSAERSPSRPAMQAAREVFPADGLARHEWRKHGTCSGLDPQSYFEAAGKARGKVEIPKQFQGLSSEETLTPGDVERAFVAANRGLRADMIAVTCSRGALQEVRVCLSKDLRDFTSCPEVNRGGCRARDFSVPPVR